MSLFHQLQKLDIPYKELENLTEKQIIRIKKELKAAIVFDKTLDRNEASQIIETLRNSKDQLKHVTTADTYWFRKIIMNPKDFQIFPINETPNKGASDETKEFILANFNKEIEYYVSKCLRENHFRALHSFLYYYKILPNSILDDIQDKLMKKIDFSLECLTIDASGLDQKIFYLYNPFFFKCLNFLDPIVTDSKLPSLVNLIIKKSDSNRTLYRVLFCMGMYYPVSESMRKVLKQNQSFAMSKGVAQQMDYKKHPKGETVSSSDNLQNGELKSYLTVFIVIVVLMTLAITFALSLSNRNTTNEEKVEENTVETFINQALKNQSDKHNALMPIQVAFNEDTIGFLNLNSNTEANKNIKITNNSDKHIALVMGVSKGYSILCLKPNQTRSTSFQFNYYTIYQGGFPTKYAIFTEKGDLKRAFLFREFDYTDKNMLQDRKLSPISFSSTFNYTLEINSGILELKSKESRPLETQ